MAPAIPSIPTIQQSDHAIGMNGSDHHAEEDIRQRSTPMTTYTAAPAQQPEPVQPTPQPPKPATPPTAVVAPPEKFESVPEPIREPEPTVVAEPAPVKRVPEPVVASNPSVLLICVLLFFFFFNLFKTKTFFFIGTI